MLDSIYKTNKYGMALFKIISINAYNRSFYIAFTFLSSEEEEDYYWALERLRLIYEVSQIRIPSIILIDRCLALYNAIVREFPATIYLLCL